MSWRVVFDVGVAPKTIIAIYRNYKLSYHVYWVAGNLLRFWYAVLFKGKKAIEFSSVEELEKYLIEHNLPSCKSLPYLS
jgi:hypothetical protein